MKEHTYFNEAQTYSKDEHTLLIKKTTSASAQFLNPFPGLSDRKKLDFEIIANNKSFVCNRNRGHTPRQAHVYEKGMRTYGIPLEKYGTIGEYCHAHVSAHSKKVIDIGFGSGDTLVSMACEEKDTGFFAIDVYKPGITSMCTKLFTRDIKNVRVIHNDAVPVLFYKVEDSSIDRIQLFFPDPWPKRKHNKRRLVQKRFLQLCTSLLKPNGVLWIVTDWEEYAHRIRTSLQLCTHEHMQFMDTASVSLLKDPGLLEILERQRARTAFERKGERKGHTIFPFVYRKVVE